MYSSSSRWSSCIRPSRRPSPCEMATLECRLLLHGLLAGGCDEVGGVEVLPAMAAPAGAAEPRATAPKPAGVALAKLPALHSDTQADAVLFLDFDGDVTATWGAYRPRVTPAFDQDGDPESYSARELAAIRSIWARVADAFSPFNIDVTTVDPGHARGDAVERIVIGGDGRWFGEAVGGINYVGGFSNGLPNTGWVFTKNLGNGNARLIGLAAIHEAGHGFGLQHQGRWKGTNLVSEYNGGNGRIAPFMGSAYDAARGIWWVGPTSISNDDIQDDLAVISGSENGFGYRPDDHGNDLASADPLAVVDGSFLGRGTIGKASDRDVFSVALPAGRLRLSASPGIKGGMLDVKVELHSSSGSLLGFADTASPGGRLTVDVAAGIYSIAVAGHGGRGDIGQYIVEGTVMAGGNSFQMATLSNPRRPAAPSAVRGLAMGSNRIRLSWGHDGANLESFVLQRSQEGGRWVTLGTLPAGMRTMSDKALRPETMYAYRLRAVNGTVRSPFSAVVRIRTRAISPESGAARAASRTSAAADLPRAAGGTALFSVRPVRLPEDVLAPAPSGRA